MDTGSRKNWIEEAGGRPMAAAATSATALQTPVFIDSPAGEDTEYTVSKTKCMIGESLQGTMQGVVSDNNLSDVTTSRPPCQKRDTQTYYVDRLLSMKLKLAEIAPLSALRQFPSNGR